MTQHFRTLADLTPEELRDVIARAVFYRNARGTPEHPRPLDNKSVAVVFEKASTRTRVSFEVGIHELGGNPVVLIAKDTQMGRGEPLQDTARMFSGYVHAIVYRTFGHERIEQMAEGATVPVINGLSDSYHPCQLVADLQTMQECFGRSEGLKVAWIGDGNNMANSWILAAGMLGFELAVACPEGFDPDPDALERARTFGHGTVNVVRDPAEAAEGAHVVTTDVWASMGQEAEAERRRRAFARFCVDPALMARAHDDAIFLHCLPAHRGEEVQADVIDGPQSRIFQEAENRLHAQKALLEWAVDRSQDASR